MVRTEVTKRGWSSHPKYLNLQQVIRNAIIKLEGRMRSTEPPKALLAWNDIDDRVREQLKDLVHPKLPGSTVKVGLFHSLHCCNS